MKIRLTVNNVTLPIEPGQSVVKEFESNLLNREPEVTEFTYTFKVGLTDEAIKVLNYPHLLENAVLPASYAGRLIIDEIFIREITIHILKVYTETRIAEVTVVGDYGSYKQVVGDKKLSDLVLGGVRTIGTMNPSSQLLNIPQTMIPGSGDFDFEVEYFDCDTATYMEQLANNSVTDDYVFPMCVLTGAPDLGETIAYGKTILNGFFANGTTGVDYYYDPIDVQIGSFFSWGLLQGVLGPGAFAQLDLHYWVPMFRLSFVLKKCFTEFGFTIVPGSYLDDVNFQKIVLFNTYAINKCTATEETIAGPTYKAKIWHDATTVNPQNHMPDMTIIDFIHEVGKMYNMQFDIDYSAMTVTVRLLGQFSWASPIVDITAQASKFSVINNTQTEALWKNGYRLEFEFDPADGLLTDEEKMNNPIVGTWAGAYTYRGTMQAAIGSYSAGAIAFLRSENAYYEHSGDGWEFYCDGLGAYKSNPNTEKLQEIRTKVVPMAMRQHDFMFLPAESVLAFGAPPTTSHLFQDILTPTAGYSVSGERLLVIEDFFAIRNAVLPDTNVLGSIYTKSIPKTSIQPRVMNWLGRHPMKSSSNIDIYPFASPGQYDINGHLIGSSGIVTHIWAVYNESTGLYYFFWKEWDDMLRNGLPVDLEMVIPDINFYQKLKWNYIRFKRGNLQYLLIKSTEPMPFPAVARLEAFLLK